jgi:TrmH family RNA methyltransferase
MSWKRTLEELRQLRTSKGRRTLQAFSAEGYRLLERALESKAPLKKVLVSDALKDSPPARAIRLIDALEEASIAIDWAPDHLMQEFIEGRTFGSMMGIIDTLPTVALPDLLHTPDAPCHLLILWNVMDPGNIGALSRTAMASGVQALLAVEGTDIFHPKAVRTSMGALFDLPTKQVKDGDALLHELATHKIATIGAVVQRGQAPYTTTVPTRHALLVGSEAHGLPFDIQERLDMRWSIPMPAAIDSFSVNAATSVLLYECNRQMWIHKRKD